MRRASDTLPGAGVWWHQRQGRQVQCDGRGRPCHRDTSPRHGLHQQHGRLGGAVLLQRGVQGDCSTCLWAPDWLWRRSAVGQQAPARFLPHPSLPPTSFCTQPWYLMTAGLRAAQQPGSRTVLPRPRRRDHVSEHLRRPHRHAADAPLPGRRPVSASCSFATLPVLLMSWYLLLNQCNRCSTVDFCAQTVDVQCAGMFDCRYNVEPDSSKPELPEHHLVLQDFVLEKPRTGEANVCRRRYDRTGTVQGFGGWHAWRRVHAEALSTAALLLLCSCFVPWSGVLRCNGMLRCKVAALDRCPRQPAVGRHQRCQRRAVASYEYPVHVAPLPRAECLPIQALDPAGDCALVSLQPVASLTTPLPSCTTILDVEV